MGGGYTYSDEFPAVEGDLTFTPNPAIPVEAIPDLYISYKIPAGLNLSLLVYIHGWNGQAGVVGSFDPDAIDYLMNQGIGILAVALRGRNTGVVGDIEKYRDAQALESYDEYLSIKHLINNVLPSGQIDPNKIIRYGISGAGFGSPVKFPDLYSVIVSWYAMARYGTYTGDPIGFTGWYTDDVNYQGQIQGSVGGAPLLSSDSRYLSRDHIRAARNILGKVYLYHDANDNTVKVDHSDYLNTEFGTYSIPHQFNRSTNGDFAHGNADLLIDKFGVTPGLQWVNDAKNLTRNTIPLTGTLHVAGFVFYDKTNLQIWIKKYRKNIVANNTGATGYDNQGKTDAATVVYDITNNQYQVAPIIPSTADQFFFIEIINALGTKMALLSALDTVTLKPNIFNLKPLSLSGYSWKLFYDFSNPDGYLLDDLSKVSNVFDLTGNNNFAFQQTRASRASIVSNSLDNGVLQLAGIAGTLAINVDRLEFTAEHTIVIKYDPDAATVASLSDQIIGSGSGGSSSIRLDTFSGKLQIAYSTQSNNFISNATPSNTNVGLQTMVLRRNAANQVVASIKNTSGTYHYTVGTSSGTFRLNTIGSASALTKQFAGKIYKVAAVGEYLSDADRDDLLNNF